MTTFKYRGLSRDGVKVSGVVKAYNELEAVSIVRENCSVITKIEEVKENKLTTVTIGSKMIKEKDLAIICSQFAIVLTSGLSLVRCIEMVAAQTGNKELRIILEKSAEDIAGGYTMAQSFENNGKDRFPVTFIETIRAGEKSGTLETCFARLHRYYDKLSKTKAKVISTLTYPALVCAVAAIVFIIIMVVAVPLFTKTFKELGTELPAITKGLIAVSDFLTGYWWMFLIAAGVFFISRIVLKRSEKGRLFLAEGKLKRSPLKKINLMNSSAQFANTMSTMITAGLSITKALEVTSKVVPNYLFGTSIRSVRQGVEQGRNLHDCMEENKLFPQMLTEMTGVGERSGSLEKTLDVIGAYYDNEVELTTNRLLSMLEPAITVGLAVITVVLLLAVYLPMFSMYGSV